MKTLNKTRILLIHIYFELAFLFCNSISFAQNVSPPPLPGRKNMILPTQSINFGRFCAMGTGGTVTVDYNGLRTSSGEIFLISEPSPQPAIFEIKLCPARNLSITYAQTVILAGTNGGTMTLNIGPTDKGVNGATFSTNSDCNTITQLKVGGTLNVLSNTIPGIYSGSFSITFNLQ